MKLRPTFLLAACLALAFVPVGPTTAQEAAAGAGAPFVERILPADFSAVEGSLPELLGKGADVAIIYTEDGRPEYALTVARSAETEYEVSLLYYGPGVAGAAAGHPPRLSAALDADSAGRLQRALAIKLARNVLVSSATRKARNYDRAWWILQRSANDQPPAAALIAGDNAEASPEARAFMDAIVNGLQRYVTSDPEARSQVLYDIDRYAIRANLEEKNRR